MKDIIRLNKMRFRAFHGCTKEEIEKGGIVEVDLEIAGDLQQARLSDDLEDTFDFNVIYGIVSKTVLETRYNLLEALGEEIYRRLQDKYPGNFIRIVLRKPDPPKMENLEYVEVEMIRGL